VLHGWVCDGDPKLVKLALERGAGVNAVDKLLDTPIILLAGQANTDHYASIPRGFDFGKTPPWAIKQASESRARYLRDVAIARTLMTYGADPWQRNSHKTSAASFARSEKLTELSAVLERPQKHPKIHR
jgi:hypothetical protein